VFGERVAVGTGERGRSSACFTCEEGAMEASQAVGLRAGRGCETAKQV